MNDRIITAAQMASFSAELIREEKSRATQEKYLRDVRAFAAYCAGRLITKELVLEYKQHCLDRGYAVRSINSMLASVNSFLLFAGWEDCRVKNFRLQKQIYSPEEKELTKEEYLRLLQAAEQNSQLYLLLQTICSTGIRVSELQYFTVEALRQGEITVNCKNKTRVILIPGKLRKQLLAFAKKEKIRSGAVFLDKKGKPLDRSCIWRRMKQLCEIAKVQATKVFPHNLRKLFARTFYNLEKDIAKLADILGHSSINTTRIYIMGTGSEHRRRLERLGLLI